MHPSFYFWKSVSQASLRYSPYASNLLTHTNIILISLVLSVGAAYEGVQKRTFLAMSIMIATQIPLMLILGLLYHKLGQLRKEQMHVGATKSLGSNQDGTSDEEDATEMSELLAPEKLPLKE